MTVDARQSMETQDVGARIDSFLEEAGFARHSPVLVSLTGDASDRRYVRVLLPEAPSQVLAVHPGPIVFARMPFANVARLLAAMPVPAPRILGHSDALGIIAQEDLGDLTLQAHLDTASEAEHAARYREAIAVLDVLQRRGAELASPEYLPYGLAFDEEKLTWELQFFLKHFVEGCRGAALSDDDRATLGEAFQRIAGELASEPRVVCHRDYHSRNLMLHDGRLHLIDFQDARMGPDTYDLASLLRDSYVDFTGEQVDEFIAHFLALKRHGPAQTRADRQRFRDRFELMALQRNLKALGTFGYQTTTRGNPVYLQYVPRTLNHVRTNLARHARFAELRRCLARHVNELD
jgi:aminoglycoside/choline kinase family phosphotransferase